MTTFSVWAPVAHKIEIEILGQRLPLLPQDQGWWSVEVNAAPAGTDYSFVIDGGEPLPDPRSPWQPYGVHGRSRTFDHAEFRWTDNRWQAGPLSSAVIYELHVGTFTTDGTFDAAIDRLDHLVNLGVTHVELMPVSEFSGNRGWGYDGVDLYAPHHAYGGPTALKMLIDACHARGLAVLGDVVYNHFGPLGNYLGRFGPYLTDRYRTPWGDAVNLDGPGSDQVRRFFCDHAVSWLRDYHFDGLRLDAVFSFFDSSAVHFLEQLAAEVERVGAQVGRHLALIAESNLNDPRLLHSRDAGGFGIDGQWNDDFQHAIHAYLTGDRSGYYADFGSIADIAKAMKHGFVYDGRYSVYRKRRHGRPTTGLRGHRFVVFVQNHDQVGNRIRGDRSGHLMNLEQLKVAAALLLCSPFVPMLFQGEEWAASAPFAYFTDHRDPQLAAATREGRKRELAALGAQPDEVPDPEARETWQQSQLDWSELDREPHRTILDWHRRLIRLRREHPDILDYNLDHTDAAFDERSKWLRVDRGGIIVASNLADVAQTVRVPEAQSRQVLLASHSAIRIVEEAVELPACSVAILSAAGAIRSSSDTEKNP
jgi:maltooligosyltrehalose trehalohydrolase